MVEEQKARQIFDVLSAPKSPGFCAKCHSISIDDKGVQTVNWKAYRPNPGHRPFTRFSHISHFSLLGQKGCLTCHAFDSEADYLGGFKKAIASEYASNFMPVKRTLCATCHTGELAGDTCTSCHNYHVGQFPPAIANMPMIVTDEAAAATDR